MFVISSDALNGSITITDTYTDNSPSFNKIGDDYIMSFINLKNIKYFTTLTYVSTGEDDNKYLDTYYRISKDSNKWTEWIKFDINLVNFPPFDPKYDMFIDIKWIRVGDSYSGTIKLLEYLLTGSLDRNVNDGLATVKLNAVDNELIIKPPYIFKVFKITDIEILSKGDIDNTEIYYRYSQDYGRTINNWTLFNKENIRSERINPIRFFQIEYLVKYKGNTVVSIFDINLIGDFQNVSLDSFKTNLYGVRENCNCLILGYTGDAATSFADEPTSSMLMPDRTNDPSALYQLTQTDINSLYKPYQQQVALALYNKMSNDAIQITGHDVLYVIIDPDKNGIDYTLHEYQLYNYVCDASLKVSVDQNQFPNNEITLNEFDLSLFEAFEVHITKDMFKKAFGVEKRPGVGDGLWFCEINRLYKVEHAQPVRNFNNYSIYYKVMLKKWENNANTIGVNQKMESLIKDLTKNTTIDELFALENMQDKKAVANTEQLRTPPLDTLRVDIQARIDKEELINSTSVIAKTNYDLSSVSMGSNAVTYRNFKYFYQKSDNIGFMCWFNINNITTNDVYNMFNYYANNNGIKINLILNTFIITINNVEYDMVMSNSNLNILNESVWYSLVVNLDQRNQKLEIYLYKRNIDNEDDAGILNETALKQLYKITKTITPTAIEVDDTNAGILGSDMKITNIRMFNDVIPENTHNKLLNQDLVGSDNKYIIFADHAMQKLVLPYISDSKSNPNKIRRGTSLDN